MAKCKTCDETINKTNLRIERFDNTIKINYKQPVETGCQSCVSKKNKHWLQMLNKKNSSYNMSVK